MSKYSSIHILIIDDASIDSFAMHALFFFHPKLDDSALAVGWAFYS